MMRKNRFKCYSVLSLYHKIREVDIDGVFMFNRETALAMV